MLFCHGIKNGLVKEKIEKILADQTIKSAKEQKLYKAYGLNDLEYISTCVVCSKESYENYPENNAFNLYISHHFCFIFKDLDTVETTFIKDLKQWNIYKRIEYQQNNPNIRITDLFDERQVYGNIPLENAIAIGIPYPEAELNFICLSKFSILTKSEFNRLVKKVEAFAKIYNLKILNSNSPDFLFQLQTLQTEKSKNYPKK